MVRAEESSSSVRFFCIVYKNVYRMTGCHIAVNSSKKGWDVWRGLTKNRPGDIMLSHDMKTFLLGRHGEGAARVQGKATIRDVARRAGVSIATGRLSQARIMPLRNLLGSNT